MTRQRLVHILIGVNGAGFILIGTSLAAVFKAGQTPWFGLAACAVLFLGIVIPFYREFAALRDGFAEVERETRKTSRRDPNEVGRQDVLSAGSRANPFRRVHGNAAMTICLSAFGWILAALEGLRWLGLL